MAEEEATTAEDAVVVVEVVAAAEDVAMDTPDRPAQPRRALVINIRYFFITDCISKNNISVAWCPMSQMVGDFMTKPLQGATFRKFRDLVMGVTKPNNRE